MASPPERGGESRRSFGWAGCQSSAHLPGVRSDVVELAGRHAMDNPEIGTILLHRHAQQGWWAQAAEFLRRYVARLKPGPDRELASRQLANAEQHAAANQMLAQ